MREHVRPNRVEDFEYVAGPGRIVTAADMRTMLREQAMYGGHSLTAAGGETPLGNGLQERGLPERVTCSAGHIYELRRVRRLKLGR